MSVHVSPAHSKAIKAVVTLALGITLCAVLAPVKAADANGGLLESVQTRIAQLKQPNTVMPPASGPRAVASKRIAIVTITLAEAAAKREAMALAQAAQDIGWKSTIYDAQGSATIADQKFAQAIATKPDAIVLVALDKNTVGANLVSAKRAGIPVSCSSCWDLSAENTRGSFADVEPALSQLVAMGKADAEFGYLQSGGHPKYLTMTDPALSNLAARQQGFDAFMQECKQHNGDCMLVASRPFQVANATTTLSSQAASLAQANPKFNVFWVAYDFAALNVLNGLRQAGLVGQTSSFMVSSNGDGANLDIIKVGGYQKASVAIAWSWVGYAIVDNLNRIFAGQAIVAQNVPIRLFDKTNVEQAQSGAWSGDVDYRAAFLKSWGK